MARERERERDTQTETETVRHGGTERAGSCFYSCHDYCYHNHFNCYNFRNLPPPPPPPANGSTPEIHSRIGTHEQGTEADPEIGVLAASRGQLGFAPLPPPTSPLLVVGIMWWRGGCCKNCRRCFFFAVQKTSMDKSGTPMKRFVPRTFRIPVHSSRQGVVIIEGCVRIDVVRGTGTRWVS